MIERLVVIPKGKSELEMEKRWMMCRGKGRKGDAVPRGQKQGKTFARGRKKRELLSEMLRAIMHEKKVR